MKCFASQNGKVTPCTQSTRAHKSKLAHPGRFSLDQRGSSRLKKPKVQSSYKDNQLTNACYQLLKHQNLQHGAARVTDPAGTIRTPAHFLRLCGHIFPKVDAQFNFHKMCATRSQLCRAALIRSALESSDPGAFNDGSNVQIRQLGTDLVVSEVAGAPNN